MNQQDAGIDAMYAETVEHSHPHLLSKNSVEAFLPETLPFTIQQRHMMESMQAEFLARDNIISAITAGSKSNAG